MKIEFTSKLIQIARPPYPAVFEARATDGTTWTYNAPRGTETEEENAFDALIRHAFAGRGADCREIGEEYSYLRLPR